MPAPEPEGAGGAEGEGGGVRAWARRRQQQEERAKVRVVVGRRMERRRLRDVVVFVGGVVGVGHILVCVSVWMCME